MSSAPEALMDQLAVVGATVPLWVYVFGDVGFELPVMMAFAFLTSYVVIFGEGT